MKIQKGKIISKEIKELSPKDKIKILRFLSILKKSDLVKWNEKLELIRNGKRIKNSNIIVLLKHAIKKKSKSSPKGMKFFYKSLSQINIPKKILLSKMGISIMKEKQKGENKIWRPPGKLSSKFTEKSF